MSVGSVRTTARLLGMRSGLRWGFPHPAAGRCPLGVGAPRSGLPLAAHDLGDRLYLITERFAALDDLRAAPRRARSRPGRRRLGRGAPGLEPRRRPAPRRRRRPRDGRRRRRRRATSPASAACASPRRAPATTPPPLGDLADDTILVDPPHARRRRSTPTPPRPRRRRRAVGGRRRPRLRARARRAGRLLARRRRRRLHARRRPELAGAQARPGRQQRRRRPGRHRRRARRASSTPSTTPTCSGRCAAAAATSASSPRSSSSSTRSTRSTPACSSGRGSAPREVLRAWREWTRTAPDEVTSLGAHPAGPAAARHPRAAARPRFVVIDGAPRRRGDGAELLAPLRALGPEIDTFATIGARRAAADAHGPAARRCPASATAAARRVPAEAIDALVRPPGRARARRCCRSSCASSAARWRASRRAPARSRRSTATSRCSRSAWRRRGDGRGGRRPRRCGQGALAPWDAGKRYLNFAERPVDTRRAYTADAYRRLRAVKTLVDPDDVFRANHPIAPID